MENNFAQQVKFEIKEKEVATMTINGVATETQKVKYVSAKCPNCGSEIISFQEGVRLVDIYKQLAQISPVKDFPKFCHECGTRIMCDKSIVGEQTYEA